MWGARQDFWLGRFNIKSKSTLDLFYQTYVFPFIILKLWSISLSQHWSFFVNNLLFCLHKKLKNITTPVFFQKWNPPPPSPYDFYQRLFPYKVITPSLAHFTHPYPYRVLFCKCFTNIYFNSLVFFLTNPNGKYYGDLCTLYFVWQ